MYQYKTIEEYAEKLKSTQYMSWIDLWRGFAIILVTMFHCGVQKSLGLGVFPVDFFDNIWFNIALPPFIFLSGYAMLINYPQVNDYKMYLKKKLKYIIPNYLIWGSAISIFYRFWQLSNFYQITNLIDIFYLILFSLLSLFTGNVWGLYFIFVLIQFYIFYPLLLKIINKFRKPLLFFLFYFLFLLILSLISTYSVDLLSISELTFSIQFNNTYEMKLNYLGFLFISKQFLDYLSFFIFGIICAKYKKVISKLNYYKLIIILLIPIYIQFYLIVYFDIFGGYFTWINRIIISL
jgi:peptidoglycan/LPS O-acetylase OafA/YrhL